MTAPGPIEGYGLLSDLRTAALVDRDGSVDWLCLPRFDSPSCFARLLGTADDGRWRIGPTASAEVSRRYRTGCLVLETDFRTATGTVRLIDAMTPEAADTDDAPELLRVVEGLEGEVEIEMDWVVRFAYGHAVPWVRRVDDGILAVAGPQAVLLRGDPLPVGVPGERRHQLRAVVRAGERMAWTMQWVEPLADELPPAVDASALVEATDAYWRAWNARLRIEGPHAEVVRRSLITLKALSYLPTGAMVAAPTTSLPEAPSGPRNWDYRYCWLRDATFTLLALDAFGAHEEARAWGRWLLRAVAGDPADLQVMYGLGGERHLVEWEADWLPGYHGATPVRIGNGAFRQVQLDVFGELMDAMHVARERGLDGGLAAWDLQLALLEHLETIYDQPDHGLWEVRGPPRRFTHSQVMVWVAFDRAVRGVREHGLEGPVERWERLRDRVHAEVMDQGWSDDVGAFTQSYGGRALDAATLLLPVVGFLPGDHPAVLSTLDAIGRELKHGDLVDRYSTTEERSPVDGMAGEEGAFLLCSFWYVDALFLAGRREEAEAMFARLVERTNDLGLLAEEVDPTTGAFLGNFPQAFSHLGLAGSAALLWGGTRRHRGG